MLDDSYGSGTPKYAVVATQPWVMEILENDVWPKIRSVNNLASTALEKANQALTDANKGITLANSALKKVKEVAESAVTKAKYDTGSNAIGIWHFLDSNDNEKFLIRTVWVTHEHNVLLKFEGGSLTGKTSDPVEFSDYQQSADFSAGVINLHGDSSTGKLSWTTYGGKPENFNIADTAFYKKAAVKSAQITAVGGEKCHITITFLDDSTKDYATSRLSFNSSSKIVELLNSNNDPVASISVSSLYTSAYKEGWNDCRNAATAHTITKYSRTSKTLYTKNRNGTYSQVSTTYYYRDGTTTSGYDLPSAK